MPECTPLIAALLLGASAAHAQVAGAIGGVVLAPDGRGVPGVTVTALDAQGTTRATTITDSTGRFRVSATADTVQLLARRLGYAPTGSGWLATGTAAEDTLRIAPLPQTLGKVVIEGSELRQEFAARMARATGRQRNLFLDSVAIASSDAPSVERLVDRVRFNRFAGQCVVLDRWFVGRVGRDLSGQSPIFRLAAIGELRGVEIYEDPRLIPTELARRISWPGGQSPCGRVIVLWTAGAFGH